MAPRKSASKAAPKDDGTGTYPAWSRSVTEVASKWGVNLATGLSPSVVEARRAVYGFNELKKEASKPLWKLILEQFDDPLVKILLVSAAVSLGISFLEDSGEGSALSKWVEPGVIVLILILNATVGVAMENNAESALEALKELQSDTAKTLRDGKLVSDLHARELVPGDVVELRVGDKVPADLRVARLKTATVRVEQASLTGESMAVTKAVDGMCEADAELQAQECMLFAGTTISNGQCVGIVNSIGMDTQIGKIQASITEAAGEEEDTPLKKKLDEFGDLLTQVITIICILVWVTNYKSFVTWQTLNGNTSWIPDVKTVEFSLSKCTYYFKIAVALAVAAIPEGLPAVITTCLALGTRSMAKKNAIVRKLSSVETLGCTTVICSDKTGTLTTNQMSAVKLVTLGSGAPKQAADLRVLEVQGTTYSPEEGGIVGLRSVDAALAAAASVCALCNDARIEWKADKGTYACVGESTEGALKVLVEKIGASTPAAQKAAAAARAKDRSAGSEAVCDTYAAQERRLAVLEFDRGRKSMSVLVAPTTGKGTNRLLAKGATEHLLERCTHAMTADGTVVSLTKASRDAILKQASTMAGSALRVLGLAIKEGPVLGELATYDGERHPAHKLLQQPEQYEALESGLTFVGLAGLRDPPRPEVRASMEACQSAGIRVIVITGDNKLTAEAICAEIGVFDGDDESTTRSLTGRELSNLSYEQQKAFLISSGGGRVISRAEPRHKQDIVRLLKECGEVVAMTGDGVNDAPALKLANIGIAMGITGTEVAKEASDMVLADDNFSTIVAAVEEGRGIYMNMKAFIRYMISSNIGEVASIFLTGALGMPEGMVPVQLLWVNLVTDGPPATALGFNPPDMGVMSKPPRRSDDALITPWVLFRYLIIGTYVGCATVGAFGIWFTHTHFMGLDLSRDGHSTVTFHQLTHWTECEHWAGFKASPWTDAYGGLHTFAHPCDVFKPEGKAKASTLSLSVLVVIEMFNALNALSEDGSLLHMPPWVNPFLLVAIAFSIGVHCVILYVPWLAAIFQIVPLSGPEWGLVIGLSAPVVLIDEVLKMFGRHMAAGELSRRRRKSSVKKQT